jgi:hypothetical protein
VIIAWLLSPLSAGILYWKQNEVEHVDPAAAAASGDAAAVQDAFPSAGAPPLPPGTAPAYGSGGGAPYAGSGPYGGGGGPPYAPPGVPAYDNVT